MRLLITRIPTRKCSGLFTPCIILTTTILWFTSVLILQRFTNKLAFDISSIDQQSKDNLGEMTYITRRLSDISQKMTETRSFMKSVGLRASQERKLVIWGIEEDGDENDESNVVQILKQVFDVDLRYNVDIESVERLGISRVNVPRPMLIYMADTRVKKLVIESFSRQTHVDLPIELDDKGSIYSDQTNRQELACTTRIQTIGLFNTISKRDEKIGAWLHDVSPENDFNDVTMSAWSAEKNWIALKAYGNRVLQEYDNNSSTPTANFTLPYPWGGSSHVIAQGNFYYVRAKSNFLVKYDLKNRRMIRYRQLKDAQFGGKDDQGSSCAYDRVPQSHISLQMDESGLWATYCSSRGSGTMKLARLDPDSLKVIKEYDTKWRKPWFEAIFVTCGVAYAIRRFDAKPHFQIKYSFSTYHSNDRQIPARKTVSLGIEPKEYGRISQLSYNMAAKRLIVWTTKGFIGWMTVGFDYVKVVQ